MKYKQASLAGFSCVLPENIVRSEDLERELQPIYQRLHLPEGRLELMTGIQERRFWNPGTIPSDVSTQAAQKLLKQTGIPADKIGCLIHCSVSRNFVEPATSTVVHGNLKLRGSCMNFDISNACLGVVSGIMMLANMVELGQIEYGLAVSGENGGPLVKNTIKKLNADLSITRKSIKDQFASLTIGSAATAVLVCRHDLFPGAHRILAAESYSDCTGNELCQGDANGGMTDDSAPLMATDSHVLMVKGIAVAKKMWERLKKETPWTNETVDLVCGHQVGRVHRNLLFQELGLPVEKDYPSFPFMGNCGSASLPATTALAAESGALKPGMHLAMLGIGSGINSSGLSVIW